MKINYISIIFNASYVRFLIRLFSIYIVFISLSGILITKLNNKIYQKYEYTIAKIYLKGLIYNPEALIISSDIYYRENRYEKSREDLILALGIYEMNGAYPEKVKELRSRINYLDRKIALSSVPKRSKK